MLDEYLDQGEVIEVLGPGEIQRLGTQMDAALRAQAVGEFSRDEAVLGCLAHAENAMISLGRAPDYDAIAGAAIDYVASSFMDNAVVGEPRMLAVEAARSWAAAGVEHHAIVSAMINVAQGRMDAYATRSGRVVFVPKSSMKAELRNRWFDVLRHRQLSATGRELVSSELIQTAVIWIDENVRSRESDVKRRSIHPPDVRWYVEYCEHLAEFYLNAQFAGISSTEMWGGLTVGEQKRALRFVWRRALGRLIVHQRAAKLLAEFEPDRPPIFLSAVEVVGVGVLAGEISTELGIAMARAEQFVASMTRAKGQESESLMSFPLVPLSNGRLAFMPSCVLYGNWPHAREQATGRGSVNPSGIGNERDKRFTALAVSLVSGAGLADVTKEVLLESEKKQLTDLDVVAVDATRRQVLVLQLKAFVTPSNLIKLKRASQDVARAYEQCDVAAANLDIVKAAVEERLKLNLGKDWSLLQVVVVEANLGVDAHEKYPAISMEWLEGTGVQVLRDGGIRSFYEAARALPDAAAYIDTVAVMFEIFDDLTCSLKSGERVAIFGYYSEPYAI